MSVELLEQMAEHETDSENHEEAELLRKAAAVIRACESTLDGMMRPDFVLPEIAKAIADFNKGKTS